jgi:sugar lactone lactonase YvrE
MIGADTGVDLVVDVRADLGEGPLWDDRAGCLYFVDILRARVHRFRPDDGALRTYAIDRFVGAAALSERGDLILAIRDGFARLNPDTGVVQMIASVGGDPPDRRMNDGACDAAGRFWAGTMALDERPDAGALYCLEPDGSVRTALQPVSISNGIDWSFDNTRMFFVDSPTQSVDVFDFDLARGVAANRRTFVGIAPELGMPDGLTVDAEEHVWVALWGGGVIHRYAPDGALDAVVRVPAVYPTSCAFGGADLRDLYITTAAIRLTPEEQADQPSAGGVFRCRPGPRGRAPHRFKG